MDEHESTSLTEPLSEGEQMFLQRLMAAQTLNQDEASALLQKCVPSDSKTTLEGTFKSINKQLTAGFGLEICTVVGKHDSLKYHCIRNMQSDEVAKEQCSPTGFATPAECDYIRKIMEALCNDEDLPRMDLLNLKLTMDANKFPKFSFQQAEAALDRMVLEKWIVVPENDENTRRQSQSNKILYAIGPRSYLELRNLLTDFGVEDLPQAIYYRSL